MSTNEERLHRLDQMRAEALLGGGAARIERQHASGKLTARERLDLLLDPGSFVELDAFVTHRATEFGLDENHVLGDGVVTGHGTIDGRLVFVFSQDFTVFGGSLSEAYAEKICKVMDLAMKVGAPIIGLNDSGGARIQEGVASLGGYAEIFLRNVLASGVVPQISVVLGPCAGGAVYSPAITDFTIMVEGTSYMFVTGPNVVKTVTHEEVDAEFLGGATTHTTRSGVAHLAASDEGDALDAVRGSSRTCRRTTCRTAADRMRADPAIAWTPTLDRRRPRRSAHAVRHARRAAARDRRRRLPGDPAGLGAEHHRRASRDSADGASGIVAQQPAVLAGALDIDASIKAARFVRTCDCFNVPVVTFVDVPGFMPGVGQEHGGHHPAGREVAVRLLRGDGPEGDRHHPQGLRRRLRRHEQQAHPRRHELRLADRRDRGDGRGGRGQHHLQGCHRRRRMIPRPNSARLVAAYRDEFANPYVAAARGYVDDVIRPSETRPRLIRALDMLADKRDTNPPKKHGNIPL